MPNILHRLRVDAPPERVHQLAATREGIQQWWTGHPVAADDKLGRRLSVYFRVLYTSPCPPGRARCSPASAGS